MSIKIKGAIEWFERRAEQAQGKGSREAYLLAVAALREKAEREDPKPLTLEELRQMEDEPFYVHIHFEWRGTVMPPKPLPAILDTVKDVEVAIYCGNENRFLKLSDYGKTWTAYRHKPREG